MCFRDGDEEGSWKAGECSFMTELQVTHAAVIFDRSSDAQQTSQPI
jgi:hypothetical protein